MINNGNQDQNGGTWREQDGTVKSTAYPYSQGIAERESRQYADQLVGVTRTFRQGAIRRTDTITGGILRSQIETNRNLAALLHSVYEHIKVQTLELEELLAEHQRRIDQNP